MKMTRKHLAVAGLGLAALLPLGGCNNQPLFPENTPRSQYERYDELRGRTRHTTEPGPYGKDEPALRDRLGPLDQP